MDDSWPRVLVSLYHQHDPGYCWNCMTENGYHDPDDPEHECRFKNTYLPQYTTFDPDKKLWLPTTICPNCNADQTKRPLPPPYPTFPHS